MTCRAFSQTLRTRHWPLAAVLLMTPVTAVTAQEPMPGDQVNMGIAQSASPQLRASAEEEKRLRVPPSHRFEFADHVANGIAMRNRTAGTIHLRGAPVPSRVMAALLYFNFSDDMQEGRREVPVLFNNTGVVATRTADHVDPCWGMTGNHSYVADVTRLVPIGGHLNQDYDVVVQFGAESSTSGQNAWSPIEPNQRIRMEGATLVVVYRTQDTTGAGLRRTTRCSRVRRSSIFSTPASTAKHASRWPAPTVSAASATTTVSRTS